MGIKPDDYWDNTHKQNHLLGEAYEIKQNKEWERVRQLGYYTLIASFNDMNGKSNFKNIKKPKDLFPLPQDNKIIRKKVVIDKEQQAKAVERHKKMMANIK